MVRSTRQRWDGGWGRWADERAAGRDAGVAGEWSDRHASRVRWASAAGAGEAETGSTLWAAVRVPGQARRSGEAAVARRPGTVPAGQAGGSGEVHLAANGTGSGAEPAAPSGLPARGVRMQAPAPPSASA